MAKHRSTHRNRAEALAASLLPAEWFDDEHNIPAPSERRASGVTVRYLPRCCAAIEKLVAEFDHLEDQVRAEHADALGEALRWPTRPASQGEAQESVDERWERALGEIAEAVERRGSPTEGELKAAGDASEQRLRELLRALGHDPNVARPEAPRHVWGQAIAEVGTLSREARKNGREPRLGGDEAAAPLAPRRTVAGLRGRLLAAARGTASSLERDALAEIDRLGEEVESYEELIELQRSRMQPAIELWRNESAGREGVSPDLGALLEWLLVKLSNSKRANEGKGAALLRIEGERDAALEKLQAERRAHAELEALADHCRIAIAAARDALEGRPRDIPSVTRAALTTLLERLEPYAGKATQF